MTKEQVRTTALNVMHILATAHESAIVAYWTRDEYHINDMFKHLHRVASKLGYKLVKVEDGVGGQG